MNQLKDIHAPHLGWGLLLAWVFCTFYLQQGTPPGFHPDNTALALAVSITPVATAVAALIALVAAEERIGALSSRRWAYVAAPLLTAASTPFLFAPLHTGAAGAALYLMGSAIAGIGSAALWVLWGEEYVRWPQERVEAAAPASAAIAALCAIAVTAMQGWVACAFVTGFPLVSGACLALCRNDGPDAESETPSPDTDTLAKPATTPRDALHAMGRSGWGILAACLFVCVLGGFSGAAIDASVVEWALVAALFLMAVVAFFSTKGPRRISVGFVYRWMCPVLVAGFVAPIIAPDQAGPYAAFAIAVAARFAFCLITQMHFAQFATRRLATATQSYGLGWIFVHTGDLLGVLVLTAIQGAGVGTTLVSCVCIVALASFTMYVLGETNSFGQPAHDAALPDSTTPTPTAAAEDPLDARVAHLADELGLTPRERDVFALLMRGRSVPYIRDELMVSRETVATHVKHIYQKAGVHSRQELLDLGA